MAILSPSPKVTAIAASARPIYQRRWDPVLDILLRSRRWARARGSLCALLLAANGIYGAETALPEQHVKSLFLFNFAKYVEWPAESFSSSNAPIVIGVLRDKRLSAELVNTVEGKSIGGRPLVVRSIERDDEISGCHILYFGASEKGQFKEILEHTQTKPLLTVSDIEQFARSGGIIGFIKKEDKIRLEIDLVAAHQARLQISSRLLSVADTVNGKR